jgi:hypothetical protein
MRFVAAITVFSLLLHLVAGCGACGAQPQAVTTTVEHAHHHAHEQGHEHHHEDEAPHAPCGSTCDGERCSYILGAKVIVEAPTIAMLPPPVDAVTLSTSLPAAAGLLDRCCAGPPPASLRLLYQSFLI